MLKKLHSPLPAIAWFILIHCAMLFPFHGNPDHSLDLIPDFDKLVHFGMFFGLCLFTGFYLSSREKDWPKASGWIVFLPIIASLDGLAVEFLQKLPVIHRDFEWLDALADTLGSFFGTIAGVKLYRRYRT